MLARAVAGAPEGVWLRAERQTGGKGRQGRVWVSPPGNLHVSTLVRVRPADPPAPTLALVAAVALHGALCDPDSPPAFAGGAGGGSSFSGSAQSARAARSLPPLNPLPEIQEGRLTIKWPNDIMAGEAKLAGILLERAGEAVVTGFGANLAYAPEGLGRPATSLQTLSGAGPDPAATAERLAACFAGWLARWRETGLGPVRAAWLAAAHPIGTQLTTLDGEGAFDGLNEDGALRLRLPGGAIRLIHAGDVFLL